MKNTLIAVLAAVICLIATIAAFGPSLNRPVVAVSAGRMVAMHQGGPAIIPGLTAAAPTITIEFPAQSTTVLVYATNPAVLGSCIVEIGGSGSTYSVPDSANRETVETSFETVTGYRLSDADWSKISRAMLDVAGWADGF
jgi:hypothetical protein